MLCFPGLKLKPSNRRDPTVPAQASRNLAVPKPDLNALNRQKQQPETTKDEHKRRSIVCMRSALILPYLRLGRCHIRGGSRCSAKSHMLRLQCTKELQRLDRDAGFTTNITKPDHRV